MYEHRTYVEARRRFPREGRKIRTDRGLERVVTIDIWNDTVSLKDDEGIRRTLKLKQLEAEVSQ
jgi:cell fate regulator YaaT (PSP1 superfamily)